MMRTSAIVGLAFSFGFLCATFVHYFVAHEDPAYLWDWGLYFHIYQDYGDRIISGNLNWIPSLIQDIRTEQYNPSTIVPLAPFFAAFGDARTGYILGIALVYLAPSALIVSIISLHAANNDHLSKSAGTLELTLD
jgi:hypothetical protein